MRCWPAHRLFIALDWLAGQSAGRCLVGRAVALLVLLNGLVLVSCAVAVLHPNRARLSVVVIGLTLASLQASIDEWIFTGSRGFEVDLWPLAMLASLAIAWLMTRTSVSAEAGRTSG